MHDIIAQRVRACKAQLAETEQAYGQCQERQNQLAQEIVGLRRAVLELEALTEQVVVALPDGVAVD